MQKDLDPAIDDLADRLREALGDIAFRMRRRRQVPGVGGAGFSMLSRLYREGPQSQSRLAAADGVQPQSITRALDTLETSGYIIKRPDPADGRKLVITITREGLRVLRRDADARAGWLSRAIAEATDVDDRRTLNAAIVVLNRLAATEDAPDDNGFGRPLP